MDLSYGAENEAFRAEVHDMGYNPMPDYEEPGWSPVRTPELAKDYPLLLTTGGSPAFYYRSQHKQLQQMRQQQPYALLQIHPQTAAQLAIGDGDFVYVETPLGRVRQQARLCE